MKVPSSQLWQRVVLYFRFGTWSIWKGQRHKNSKVFLYIITIFNQLIRKLVLGRRKAKYLEENPNLQTAIEWGWSGEDSEIMEKRGKKKSPGVRNKIIIESLALDFKFIDNIWVNIGFDNFNLENICQSIFLIHWLLLYIVVFTSIYSGILM